MTGLIQASDLTAEQARGLTDRIKVAVEGTWHLITEAYTSRAWAALGYTSWDDYCTREFGTSRLRLPREERDTTVASLRSSGLSIPAIAAATGLGYGTVQRSITAGYPNGQPDPVTPGSAEVAEEVYDPESGESVFQIDWTDDEPALTNEECQALDLDRAEMLTDAEEADAIEAEVKAARVIGVDGKSYPKPEPQALKPLPQTGRHHKVLAKVIDIQLDSLRQHTLDAITELDGSVTSEEAARLTDSLSKSIQALSRINRLLKERSK